MTRSGHAQNHGRARQPERTSAIPALLLLVLTLSAAGVPGLTIAVRATEPDETGSVDATRPRYVAPYTEGVANADSWVGAEVILSDSLSAKLLYDEITRNEPHADVVDPRPVRLIPPGSRPVPPIPEIPMRLSRTGVGAYAGYPSAVGALVSAPVDGSLGFRFGLAAFPGVGLAWSPGFEMRFGQERGTYSRDGYHFYTNLLFGRTYLGDDKERTSAEAGIGYRWMVSDKQGYRWIAAGEFGARWGRRSSVWPDRPSLRVYWILADW